MYLFSLSVHDLPPLLCLASILLHNLNRKLQFKYLALFQYCSNIHSFSLSFSLSFDDTDSFFSHGQVPGQLLIVTSCSTKLEVKFNDVQLDQIYKNTGGDFSKFFRRDQVKISSFYHT